MSWTRPHLDRMAKLQCQVQQLVAEGGTAAAGVDSLIQANEALTEAQGLALAEVERAERREESLSFAEALRPFAEIGSIEAEPEGQ